ncbi:hypothetical protein Zmor_027415 [Zophobas morio]|uniref:Uncharacterized protein n=1 Tax=Zophobas morio TaxID=2755281 RepID=A0AA38M2J2_9CUCU|nr:hypothetical protein Zmor_027415 [Zophobas morio]
MYIYCITAPISSLFRLNTQPPSIEILTANPSRASIDYNPMMSKRGRKAPIFPKFRKNEGCGPGKGSCVQPDLMLCHHPSASKTMEVFSFRMFEDATASGSDY